MRLLLPCLAALAVLVGCGGGGGASSTVTSTVTSTPTPTPTPAPGWVLTWSDDFGGTDGTRPDPTKWTCELGGDGWGNGELESYTSLAQNAQIQGGNLVITALKETYTGADGITCGYTSARLKTQGLFSQTCGRFEARIQIPRGQGLWPAFWMLGDTFASAGWPACGEIDIMENIGSQPATVYGSIHGPGFTGGSLSTSHALPSGDLADAFHVYAVEWSSGLIKMYLDDTLYATYTPADLPAGGQWVFDQPFFLILNVAVGGSWPGAPDSTTTFPQRMLVNYVRVYTYQ
ncbi:MAG: glycoside hydrolase family 16 protein [Holophaga sp.]|nr:glycoside hydrolase family 16 protein [Holophaga sp.]